RQGKILGFFKFNLFGHSLLGFGKSAFSAQILESLKPQNMPKFRSCLNKNRIWAREVFRAQSVERTSLLKVGIC
ncbi:hypothetical protein ACTBJ2_004776, partial [Vibrio parahaemolyticus]